MRYELPEPRCIIIEREAEKYPLTEQVCAAFAHSPRRVVPRGAIEKDVDTCFSCRGDGEKREKNHTPLPFDPAAGLSPEEYTLVLRIKKGRYLKRLPFYEKSMDFVEYYTAPVEGCIFNCRYCYLQGYLPAKQQVVIHVNHAPFIRELEFLSRRWPRNGEPAFIYTGHLADSLLWSQVTPFLKELLKWLRMRSHPFWFELRTKSTSIDTLLNVQPMERVVCAWSLNPETIVRRYENRTPALLQRIAAMKQVAEHGFKLGLRFDPVFYYPGWEGEYEELIKILKDRLQNEWIHSVSMGCFRYSSEWKRTLRDGDRSGDLFLTECTNCRNGKISYIRPIRRTLYRRLYSWIRPWLPQTPIYLSMEDAPLTGEIGI
jgi:spore photoproduct lyase